MQCTEWTTRLSNERSAPNRAVNLTRRFMASNRRASIRRANYLTRWASTGPVCRLLIIARYAWALPATIAGLLLSLVALAFGAKGRVIQGAVEIAGGRIDRCLSTLPGNCRFGAMTIGHVIIGVDHETLAHHRLHEHVHVRQYERWGVFFFPLYLFSSLLQIVQGRDPYLHNSFEREAFAASLSTHSTPHDSHP